MINFVNNNKNKLHLSLKKSGGRSNTGRMTVYTKGGGAKRKYRFIDFKRDAFFANSNKKIVVHAFVLRIEKDPNRSAYIALICYPNGILSYIIATEKMRVGQRLYNYNNSKSKEEKKKRILKTGNSFIINMLPSGCTVNNIELYPGMGSVINRAAGVGAQIIKKYDKNYVQIKLRSGEHRLIHNKCRVIYGFVSNIYNNQNKLIKAGQSRLLGRRPIVRGRAMNPVDHPHGGRTNGGTPPKTPWGLLTKGRKTRNNVKTNDFIITSRKKKD